MEHVADKYFFHYTTREAGFAHIVPSGKLRFSRYQDMRDPLENKGWRFVGGAWGAPSSDDEQAQALAYFQFDTLANEIRERSFLLSMTIDTTPENSGEVEPFCRGWARARMWEQYAENHAGLCLVFDREALTANITNSLQAQGFAAPYHRPVIYEGDWMLKPSLNLNTLSGSVTPAIVSGYIEDNHDTLFFHKALDWESEREYRFSTTSSEEDDLYVEFGEALAAVIVGEKFPVWQRPAAIELCARTGIEAKRLDWTMGAPVLAELRPIHTRRDEIREVISNTRHPGPPRAEAP
jgi:hypothetical protein